MQTQKPWASHAPPFLIGSSTICIERNWWRRICEHTQHVACSYADKNDILLLNLFPICSIGKHSQNKQVVQTQSFLMPPCQAWGKEMLATIHWICVFVVQIWPSIFSTLETRLLLFLSYVASLVCLRFNSGNSWIMNSGNSWTITPKPNSYSKSEPL